MLSIFGELLFIFKVKTRFLLAEVALAEVALAEAENSHVPDQGTPSQRQSSRASTWCAADGMRLAFIQEDFLVEPCFCEKKGFVFFVKFFNSNQ